MKTGLLMIEVFFFFVVWYASGSLPAIPAGWFPVLLGLAALHGGRSLAFYEIFRPLRDALGIVEREDSAVGANNHAPECGGIRQAVGELITCPICAGTWTAAVLLVIGRVSPAMRDGLIYVLAAGGILTMANWVIEYQFWHGRLARERVGEYHRKGTGIDEGSGVESVETGSGWGRSVLHGDTVLPDVTAVGTYATDGGHANGDPVRGR